MFLKQTITSIFCILFMYGNSQQLLSGKVVDAQSKLGIEFCTIFQLNSSHSAQSDSLGNFNLTVDSLPIKVFVSFTGYQADTLLVTQTKIAPIQLKAITQLKEFTVTEKGLGTLHSSIKTINTEIMKVGELKKAACCNLGESFENNASVDITMNDGVSGAKQISMLGLDGVYTQVLLENTPYIRALSSSYGLNFIPGSWIESIDISKGTGSVVNGYEALSGVVNVELQKPDKSDKLHLNLYGSSAGRAELNLNYQQNLSKKWTLLSMLHHSEVLVKNDFNKDGFIDLPIGRQSNAFARVKYDGERLLFQLAGQFIDDNKSSGQMKYSSDPNTMKPGQYYGINIHNQQGMFFCKTAINFLNEPYRSLGLIVNGKKQVQHSYFGNKTFEANYVSMFHHLIFQDIISDSRYKYKVGLTYLFDEYHQQYLDSAFNRTDNIYGTFGEFNYDDANRFSALAGFRYDRHNLFGNFYTPKLNLKYKVSKNAILRLSAGFGTRISNVFLDNTGLFANARKVSVLENPRPEKGSSVGINYMQNFNIGSKKNTLVLDVYRSDFQNQVVIDFYANYQQILIYNLQGKSSANAAQIEWSTELNKFFTIKAAYKYYLVKSTYQGISERKPMIPNNRALLTCSYVSKFDIWKADAAIRYTGVSRMPVASDHSNPAMHQRYSKAFITAYAQVTRAFKHWEVYAGCENLTNYLQPNAIISADKPFSDTFDATMIYGTTIGRIIYVGCRYVIK
jgi:outer membrane receptor for ferrienterochelin and colicins